MINYLKIYRPLNVLFIVAAQWLAAYFLNFNADFQIIQKGGVYWLMLGTAFVAFTGYWLNDLLDVKRDGINDHTEAKVSSIPKNLVYIHLLLFVSIVFLSTNFLPVNIRFVFLGALVLLVTYNLLLKNIAGIGNIVIALLAFVSIGCTKLLFPEIDILLLLHFAVLSAILTLCREIVKDAEDISGDQDTGAKTIPIILGKESTNSMIYILSLFSISFCIISLYYQSGYLVKPLLYVYYAYYLLFIIIPMYVVCTDIKSASNKEDYTRISIILKYVLFIGTLSILFF